VTPEAGCSGGARNGALFRIWTLALGTGEIERRGDDIGGIAVHIAQRIQGLARPGEALVSSTVKDLVAGSDIKFTDRGTRVLKGVPDQWRVFIAEA